MRRPQSSKNDARRAEASRPSFGLINLPITPHIRTLLHRFARYGAASLCPSLLTTQGHTQGPYVSAAVKGAQADRVFTRRQGRKLNGVSFLPAVGNSIIGKQRRPGRAIKAEVGLLDFAGCVSDLKHSSSTAPTRLRECNCAQDRRRVIYVHGFAQTLPDSAWPSGLSGASDATILMM